jgi:beta-lactamase superfamily II metal-dependent hydrolase
LKSDYNILIAPHHGGENKRSDRKYVPPSPMKCATVCISVGANNDYNHLVAITLKYLDRISKHRIKRTDESSDIYITI